jgi:hypothetical protein
MEATSHSVIEDVRKRRSVTKEFPDEVKELAYACAKWLSDNGIELSAGRIRQTMVTMGMSNFGPDGFVHMVWQYSGSKGDVESLCEVMKEEFDEFTAVL